MPTNNISNKNQIDLEDERERRQEQASQQPRDEMGRFEEGDEASELDVHERQTSRMSTPDDEEEHAQMSQGRRSKNQQSPTRDDSGADEADDMPVGRNLDISGEESERETQIDDSDIVSSSLASSNRASGDLAASEGSEREDSERDSQRAPSSTVGRSKQSINASKRPRDQHGRFQPSKNRGKKE